MTTFHWVRHGPTHQKNFVGWRDVPADLSDTAQIDRLAAFLPRDAFVVSSDLKRSVATADAITAGRTRLPHMPGLREFHFGAWDGVHFSAIPEAQSRPYWERPGTTAPPGGESWNAAADRVSHAVQDLIRRHPGRDIIAVAHIGVILTQVQIAQAWRPEQSLANKIDNLSVTTIDWSKSAERVIRINHIP